MCEGLFMKHAWRLSGRRAAYLDRGIDSASCSDLVHWKHSRLTAPLPIVELGLIDGPSLGSTPAERLGCRRPAVGRAVWRVEVLAVSAWLRLGMRSFRYFRTARSLALTFFMKEMGRGRMLVMLAPSDWLTSTARPRCSRESGVRVS